MGQLKVRGERQREGDNHLARVQPATKKSYENKSYRNIVEEGSLSKKKLSFTSLCCPCSIKLDNYTVRGNEIQSHFLPCD